MIRFMINFILFGILFYLIYLFFPDAFHTLVSWAGKIYEFLKDLALQLYSRFQSMRSPSTTPTHPQQAMAMILWE